MNEDIDDVAIVLGTQPEYGKSTELASYVGSYKDIAGLSTRTIAENIKQSIDPSDIDKFIAVWLVVEGDVVEKNEHRFWEQEREDDELMKRRVEALVLETITRWRQE